MFLLWVLRIALLLFFLAMFWGKRTWGWAVGLLTIAAVIFLDALREQEMLPELGFLQYFIGGVLLAGGFWWLTGILKQIILSDAPTKASAKIDSSSTDSLTPQFLRNRMLNELRADGLQDVLFDLDIDPARIKKQDRTALIDYIVRTAEKRKQLNQLKLSLERKSSPVSLSFVPTIDQLTIQTPPHLLRQSLQEYVAPDKLLMLANEMGLNVLQHGPQSSAEKVRATLWSARRVGQLDSFLQSVHTHQG